MPVGPAGPAQPGKQLENGGTFLAFEQRRVTTPTVATTEGDRTTVVTGGVRVTVQARKPLRDRIVASIRQVVVDSYGCASTHPVSRDPGRRPGRPVDVTTLTGVRSVSACKYALAGGADAGQAPPPVLLSSERLRGQVAKEAVAAVAAAPTDGGPDRRDACLPEAGHGTEAIVLQVVSDQGRSEIYLRLSGCEHDGFDDGVFRRSLTPSAVAPFLAGSNVVLSFIDGPGKTALLRP